MKSWHWLLALVFACAAGCSPTRYAWSPDGKRMTVLSDDGLRLADSSGQLLPPFLADARMATWFADSQRLAVVRDVQIGTWAQLEPMLSPAQKQRIIQAANHARDAAFEYEWDSPDAANTDRFLDFVKQRAREKHLDVTAYDDLAIPTSIYFRDHRDEALSNIIPAQWWKQLDDLKQPVPQFDVYRLDNDKLLLTATLMATLDDPVDLRPSPTGQNVAITVAENDSSNLWVVPADAHRPAVKLATNAAAFADWSADGRSVIYIAATGKIGDNPTAGALCRSDVAGSDGSLLPHVGARQTLAEVAYMQMAKVRCLRDGRIIVATVSGGAGAALPDADQHAQLFMRDPRNGGAVQPLLAGSTATQIGDAAQYFEPNPAGSRLSIPDSDGRVCVVDVASGQLKIAQEHSMRKSSDQIGLITVPQWRNDDELTMIADGANGQPTVVNWFWSTGKYEPISDSWPANVRPSKPQ